MGIGGKGLIVSVRGTNVIYEIQKICYIERGRRCCTIVTNDGVEKVNTSFAEICNQLEKPLFVQCHNSYIVNLNEVSLMCSGELTIKNGAVIPVSRKYKDLVRQCFLKWREVWL